MVWLELLGVESGRYGVESWSDALQPVLCSSGSVCVHMQQSQTCFDGSGLGVVRFGCVGTQFGWFWMILGEFGKFGQTQPKTDPRDGLDYART